MQAISGAYSGAISTAAGDLKSYQDSLAEQSETFAQAIAGHGETAKHQYFDKHHTFLGTELIGKGDRLAQAAQWIKPQNGVYDVLIHGTPDAFHVLHNGNWVELNQRSLATLIKKDGWAGGANTSPVLQHWRECERDCPKSREQAWHVG